eukprot:5481075-Pyramimonas_sp.AAC.1
MSNAFGCTSFEALQRTVEASIKEESQVIFAQRHHLSTFMIPASDGEQVLRNRCGAFMGDTPAAVFFCPHLPPPSADVVGPSATAFL